MPSLTIKGIPDDLYRLLKEQASKEHRSINAEVISILQRQLKFDRVRVREVLARADSIRNQIQGITLTEDDLRLAKDHGHD